MFKTGTPHHGKLSPIAVRLYVRLFSEIKKSRTPHFKEFGFSVTFLGGFEPPAFRLGGLLPTVNH